MIKKQLAPLLTGLINNTMVDQTVVSSLSDDSRAIKKGSLFLAYPGLTQDGRHYIDAAIENGASVILYEEIDAPIRLKQARAESDHLADQSHAVNFIPIRNLKEKMPLITARFYDHPSHDLTIVGITGTNGKTSCSHFIANALSNQSQKTAVLGTIGNGIWPDLIKSTHTTLMPIQLQEKLYEFKNKNVAIVAMEVSSHALEQGRVNQVEMDIAVFTNLSQDHLDYHGDMQKYAAAKEKLFQMPGLKHAVINLDDPFGLELAERYQKNLNVIVYSLNKTDRKNAVVAENIMATPQGYLVSVNTPWGKGEFQTDILARFNISNLLAVLGVLGVMEMPLKTILKNLSELRPPKGRLQSFSKTHKPTIIVDYAHTPDALEKTLDALREHCKGKLWCVFGCGGDRDKSKRAKMATIAENKADYIVMTNDNPRSEDPKLIIKNMCDGISDMSKVQVIFDRKDAIENTISLADVNDLVLIAGKGHETTQTMGDIVYPFSDAEVIEHYLGLK